MGRRAATPGRKREGARRRRLGAAKAARKVERSFIPAHRLERS